MAVYKYDDKEFGSVQIMTRVGMRRASMRWTDGRLRIGMPPEVANRLSVARLIDRNRERLRSLRDISSVGAPLAVGQRIECFGCAITIKEQNRAPRLLLFGYDGDPEYTISIPTGVDLTDRNVHRSVTNALLKMMEHGAREYLLPYARQVAGRLGLKPAGFEVGRGMRKLGHCTTGKVIQLSRAVMMLPPDLVDLVICHELAHLTHMDHSAAFHALCNSYLGGRERSLDKRLRSFNWPVRR